MNSMRALDELKCVNVPLLRSCTRLRWMLEEVVVLEAAIWSEL